MQIYCDHPFDDDKLENDDMSENVSLEFIETAVLTPENYNGRDWLAEIVEEHSEIEMPVFRCPYCAKLGRGMNGYLIPPNRDKPVQLYQFREGWRMSGARFKGSKESMEKHPCYATEDVRESLLKF